MPHLRSQGDECLRRAELAPDRSTKAEWLDCRAIGIGWRESWGLIHRAAKISSRLEACLRLPALHPQETGQALFECACAHHKARGLDLTQGGRRPSPYSDSCHCRTAPQGSCDVDIEPPDSRIWRLFSCSRLRCGFARLIFVTVPTTQGAASPPPAKVIGSACQIFRNRCYDFCGTVPDRCGFPG